jgi:hypothetical protein
MSSNFSSHDPFYTGKLNDPDGTYVYTGEMKNWNGRFRNTSLLGFENPIIVDGDYKIEVSVGKEYYIEVSGTINGTVTLQTDTGGVVKEFTEASAYAYTATSNPMTINVTGSVGASIVVDHGHTL